MRVLGMDPVMQGYAGMIPSDYDDVITKKVLHKVNIKNISMQ